MPVGLASKIGAELDALDYQGVVTLCGFGEPMLHPDLPAVVREIGRSRVEIVTNGDRLTSGRVEELLEAGVDYFVVSMYDGPQQREHFEKVFEAVGCPPDFFVLRDRWYDADSDFGLKLTNRAGAIDVGNQAPVDQHRACFYTAYSLTIDWNGDVLLCVQDWWKRVRFGNVGHEALWDIWTSPAMAKRRRPLIAGERGLTPCSTCNAEGTLHGANHAAAWRAR